MGNGNAARDVVVGLEVEVGLDFTGSLVVPPAAMGALKRATGCRETSHTLAWHP